eukprot:GHVL01040264.1.p1 GENE.GHVL01040264.1~~GHVL01040264.1.p1  ORF type:complete len:631 (-),score=170.96 GHVL01040264.1:647-2539(-)
MESLILDTATTDDNYLLYEYSCNAYSKLKKYKSVFLAAASLTHEIVNQNIKYFFFNYILVTFIKTEKYIIIISAPEENFLFWATNEIKHIYQLFYKFILIKYDFFDKIYNYLTYIWDLVNDMNFNFIIPLLSWINIGIFPKVSKKSDTLNMLEDTWIEINILSDIITRYLKINSETDFVSWIFTFGPIIISYQNDIFDLWTYGSFKTVFFQNPGYFCDVVYPQNMSENYQYFISWIALDLFNFGILWRQYDSNSMDENLNKDIINDIKNITETVMSMAVTLTYSNNDFAPKTALNIIKKICFPYNIKPYFNINYQSFIGYSFGQPFQKNIKKLTRNRDDEDLSSSLTSSISGSYYHDIHIYGPKIVCKSMDGCIKNTGNTVLFIGPCYKYIKDLSQEYNFFEIPDDLSLTGFMSCTDLAKQNQRSIGLLQTQNSKIKTHSTSSKISSAAVSLFNRLTTPRFRKIKTDEILSPTSQSSSSRISRFSEPQSTKRLSFLRKKKISNCDQFHIDDSFLEDSARIVHQTLTHFYVTCSRHRDIQLLQSKLNKTSNFKFDEFREPLGVCTYNNIEYPLGIGLLSGENEIVRCIADGVSSKRISNIQKIEEIGENILWAVTDITDETVANILFIETI